MFFYCNSVSRKMAGAGLRARHSDDKPGAPYERLFLGFLMKKPPARLDRWPRRRREAGRKPSSVPGCPGDDHSSWTPVARGLQRPTRELRAGRPQTLPYLVLLQVGFSKPAMSPLPLVSSYLTLSPLPWTYHGGLVSEALSLGLPPLGITQHPALWSSDFPPAASRAAGDHLACFAILWGKNFGVRPTIPPDYYFTSRRRFGQWPG